jgi:hypothetical protein
VNAALQLLVKILPPAVKETADAEYCDVQPR